MPYKPPYEDIPVERIEVHDYRARKSRPGRRLDGYLAAKFSNYSRSFLTTLIKDGKVTINGKTVKPHYEIRRDDRIHVELPVFAKPHLQAEDIPLDIVHEDDRILIVNKPADIIVHPARSHMSGTLVNALIHHCDRLPDSEDGIRPGIVHRLDRDTTGCMVVVKDAASRGWIGRQFEWRHVEKHYRTLVEGEVELDQDRIDLPLARDRRNMEKMAVCRKGGREAVSLYTVIERFHGFTFVDVAPRTGRTHQIRVHLAAIGHPVVCDAQYGRREPLYESDLTGADRGRDEPPLIARQALHAYTLGFRHPETKQFTTYTAPLPDDMQRALAALRRHRAFD
jgi:23S rRNA pseudouridine1911/1915/1917 synthase